MSDIGAYGACWPCGVGGWFEDILPHIVPYVFVCAIGPMPRHVWIEVRMQVRRQSGRRHVLLHLVHSRMFSGLDGVAQLGLVQFRRLHGQVIHSWAVANGLVGQVVPVMDLFGTALFPQSLHAPAHTYTPGCTQAHVHDVRKATPVTRPRIALRHDASRDRRQYTPHNEESACHPQNVPMHFSALG